MDNPTPNQIDDIHSRLRELRGRREGIEAAWKLNRAESRALVLELAHDHGYSVNKLATVSGHQRATIRVWLNAESVRTAK